MDKKWTRRLRPICTQGVRRGIVPRFQGRCNPPFTWAGAKMSLFSEGFLQLFGNADVTRSSLAPPDFRIRADPNYRRAVQALPAWPSVWPGTHWKVSGIRPLQWRQPPYGSCGGLLA